MPADLWTDAVRMAGCGLAVATVAAPVGLVGWILARRTGVPVLPRPRPWRVPWTGFEVIVGFLALAEVVPGLVSLALSQSGFYQQVYGPDLPLVATRHTPSTESTAAIAGGAAAVGIRDQQLELSVVRGLWAGVLSLPLQIGLVVLARYAVYPAWRSPTDPRAIPARVALGTAVWAVLTPAVLVVHTAVNLLFTTLDVPREDHPLSKLSPARPAVDHLLFFLQAGVAAPLVEELLFRGLLLAWLVGGRTLFGHPVGANLPRPGTDRRVWPVLAIGVVMAAYLAHSEGEVLAGPTRGPVLFAVGLLAGWFVLRLVFRRKRRTAGAVYASAALFAVVHSGVWPTPVPLFALGLGLGWLAVRTRGILASAIVHGLFNAVSVLFVLQGG